MFITYSIFFGLNGRDRRRYFTNSSSEANPGYDSSNGRLSVISCRVEEIISRHIFLSA